MKPPIVGYHKDEEVYSTERRAVMDGRGTKTFADEVLRA